MLHIQKHEHTEHAVLWDVHAQYYVGFLFAHAVSWRRKETSCC